MRGAISYTYNTKFHQYVYCKGGRHLLWSYDPTKITVLDTRKPLGEHNHEGSYEGEFGDEDWYVENMYCAKRYISGRNDKKIGIY